MSNATELSIGRPEDHAAVRSVEFGDVRATYVVDGLLTTRPDVFFPAAPAEYFAGVTTAAGELVVSAGGLLVETPDSTILIDTGAGAMNERFIYGHANCGMMLAVLDALGVGVGDIDVVALTHLHFDHAGGAFVGGRKTFPNARYVLAAQELAPHVHQEPDSHGDVAGDTAAHLAAPGSGVELITDGAVLTAGVQALVTGGHTHGHTTYIVTSSTGQRLVAFGDAFNSHVQISHPELLSAADVDGAGVSAARRRLLGELSAPDTIGFGIHFGDQTFGRVVTTTDGTATWDPVPTAVRLPPPIRPSGGSTGVGRHNIERGPW
jgi:glyoxylase-like metal-dependent hydrolase (beta-lactamase superfamily II)